MPTGTRVDRCYRRLKGKKGKGSAAAICQSSTGQSLATGRKPKHRGGRTGKHWDDAMESARRYHGGA